MGSSPINVASFTFAPRHRGANAFLEVVLDALEALHRRRSIGKLGGVISDDLIDRLLDAALQAPNHRMTEPWRFTVVQGAARERLGRAWASIVGSSLPEGFEGREARLEAEARKLLRAPAIIVASVRTDEDPVVAAEDFAAVCAAVQNMLIAAVALGAGAIWRTGAMAYDSGFKRALNLDPTDRIAGLVYVGEPQAEPKPAQPRSFERAVRRLAQ